MIRPTKLVAVTLIGLLGALLLPATASAAPRCLGRVANIVGTPGRDRLQGTPRSDVIVGLGGRDEIAGRGGKDRICGGGGQDVLIGQAGNDLINGGAILDVGVGGPGNDVLTGSGGDDVLVGQGGEDRLLGGPSGELEVLAPGSGDDLVNGGGGTLDLVTYADSGQGVVVSLSITTPQPTGQGMDGIVGVEGLEGSDFDDELTGNGLQTFGGNGLFGLGGDDILFGGEGDDLLDGGAEASQDTGDGGEGMETDGDLCVDIEVESNCELEAFAVRAPASWAGASGTTRDTWSRFRL
jgi:hypothetical protein